MFARLVQKELLHHLLDFRFIAVFALCALLSVLSVYVGGQNHLGQLREYSATLESHRKTLQGYMDKSELNSLRVGGERWVRRPEVLTPMVYGLSGKIGQEVNVQLQRLPKFEASLFEEDPIYAVFEVLDLSFIVKVVLSLCVLLFTYDTVCGEKEGGTLRLYTSFPVSRPTVALAKLVGSAIAVLVPFSFSYLLAATALALFPEVRLGADDWLRMAALMVVFGLYLVVFSAFGLLASALTHRRMTAFLSLLGLWTIWIFILPDMAVYAARRLMPTESPVALQRRSDALLWEIGEKREAEVNRYWESNPVQDWDRLPDLRKRELLEGRKRILDRWDAEHWLRLAGMREEYRNRARRQQRLSAALSAISPLGAVTFASIDLARTGFVQQERIEEALGLHLAYLGKFVREKESLPVDRPNLMDYSRFAYQDNEAVGECLSRNALYILNLALLAILGFAGAYAAILRYDVR